MKGETLKVILSTLEELGYAYNYDVLNAKYFGVPQNRERVILIGIKNGEKKDRLRGRGVRRACVHILRRAADEREHGGKDTE